MDNNTQSISENPVQDCSSAPPALGSSDEVVATGTNDEGLEVVTSVPVPAPAVAAVASSDEDTDTGGNDAVEEDSAEIASDTGEKEASVPLSTGTDGESGEVSVLVIEKQNVVAPEQSKITPADEPSAPVFPPLPLPEPISDYRGCISAFGFSQRGESHVKKNIPCQDRSSVRFISDSVVISAVADGVGSCALSDYGAATAVTSSLNYLEEQLAPKLKDPSFTLDVLIMGNVLREMMQLAYEKVRAKAEEMEQLLYSLQSTLTVAVFDGKTLYFAHAGDDGIVAITQDGKCELATTRHKGEEASSVYPLQSRNTWQYGKVDNVVGFVMATDGVLDAFVRNETEGNRVYYPFIEPAFSTPLSSKEEVTAACNDWNAYMKTPQYRSSVTDDLSFVCVINQRTIKAAQKPSFDMNEWTQKSKEYEERRRAALYPPKSQQAKPAPQTTSASTQRGAPDNPSATQQPRPRQNTVPNQEFNRNPYSAGQTNSPYTTPPRTVSSPQNTTTRPYNAPVQPNIPYYCDKAGRDDLLEAGKKALEGLGGILLVSSEMILDAGSDAIRALRNKRKEIVDSRSETQSQNAYPNNSGFPQNGNNGNGGSSDEK